MRIAGEVLSAVCQHGTDRSHGGAVQVHDAQISQAGLREDNTRNYQNGAGNNGTQSVGVKDSGGVSRNFDGYCYISESFMRGKVIEIAVNRAAVDSALLARCK